MATDAQSLEQSSGSVSSGLGRRVLFLLGTVIFGFFLYKWDWWVGTFWLLLASLLYIWFLLPEKRRVAGLWLWVFTAAVTVIGGLAQGEIAQNPQLVRTIQDNAALSFLAGGYGESVFWATVLGVFMAVVLLGLLIFSATYIAAVFVLNLPEFNGAGRVDAVRHVLMLLLGGRLPTITIENGQAIINEKSGKLADIGGPGILTIKEGNVVILERKGKISRIINAGAQKIEKGEKIRNILMLTPQGNRKEIEHVLTKDRIPLRITLGIVYQIEPASAADERLESRMAPNGEALSPRLDDGLFQVYEETVRKAARIAQREWDEWKETAGGLPEDSLRDHILGHNFDELFEVVTDAADGSPEVRVDKRKLYEIEQAIVAEVAPGRLGGLGVVVRGIDIVKIRFPVGAERQMLYHWKVPWQQDMSNQAAEGRVTRAESDAKAMVVRARAAAQARILQGQGDGEARAAFFREVLREIKREATLGNEEMIREVLKQLIDTMVSVQDLEKFIRATATLTTPARRRLSAGFEEAAHTQSAELDVDVEFGDDIEEAAQRSDQ